MSGREGVVKGGEFVEENADGPTVGDDVMHVQEQDVILVVESKQGSAEQGAMREVEGALGFLGREAERFRLAGLDGQGCQVHLGQRGGARGSDNLDGLALDDGEGGAQGFMAPQDFSKALAKRDDIEGAGEAEGERNVVVGALGLPLG